ncbi:hypothetical protein VB713_04790 [Anabaena cylindrica UHCC 0172]|uniref:hypothetical protein n=1 Tax=Anabaena cylindrica TaxID=1165 RepID=UPI002B1EF534|nr:hypothetical protein [Anabaena cylindrica]MEA5550307.1 hypothetical protein [Anabaena cylindrica UHCC 0172]
MSKVLTVELNDDVYIALQQQATAVGVSVAELVTASLNRQYSLSVSPKSDAEPETRAREFREWVSQIPETGLSLPDEAFNRDSIYEE